MHRKSSRGICYTHVFCQNLDESKRKLLLIGSAIEKILLQGVPGLKFDVIQARACVCIRIGIYELVLWWITYPVHIWRWYCRAMFFVDSMHNDKHVTRQKHWKGRFIAESWLPKRFWKSTAYIFRDAALLRKVNIGHDQMRCPALVDCSKYLILTVLHYYSNFRILPYVTIISQHAPRRNQWLLVEKLISTEWKTFHES